MTESKLAELLEHAADRTEVGPPPLDALYAGASRRRRRRTALLSGVAVAAVVAAVGGTTLLTSKGDPAPATSPSPAPAPVAMRLVGFGHAAIAVPAAWGTNQYRCVTPQSDTVVIDIGFVTLCGAARPADVESVKVSRGRPNPDYHADEMTKVDGVAAERQRTTCGKGPFNRVETCTGAVYIPSLDVAFEAASSTSAEEVDRILGRIVIVPDRVGVPGYRTVDRRGHQPSGPVYATMLKQIGLKPKIRTGKSSGYSAGTILTASPGPGTMLAPGSTVTITVAG